ncbi:hypothetical protein G6F45_013346 [Rhizopus arrhizus]|nr:hypothetical protein G6F45_013346 [Rhizopus arrhizus]
MGPLRKNLGSRIPNAAASTNSANSNADVTLQSLAAAYQDLTARLSALEQLQLENARLVELTKNQANEIDSLLQIPLLLLLLLLLPIMVLK